MAEHPILFNTEMVRAILDGRKTMTRRVIGRGVVGRMMSGDQRLWPYAYDKRGKSVAVPCPYGQPGDLLWVRETWRPWAWWEGERWVFQYRDGISLEARAADMKDEERQEVWERHQWIKISEELIAAGHKTDDDGVYHFQGDPPLSWRPSIHMPRWASRITLEVTSVRVERVQDISSDDAQAEGVNPWFPSYDVYPGAMADYIARGGSYRNGFHELWDKINKKRGYSWHSNPWVWVVEFKVI